MLFSYNVTHINQEEGYFDCTIFSLQIFIPKTLCIETKWLEDYRQTDKHTHVIDVLLNTMAYKRSVSIHYF